MCLPSLLVSTWLLTVASVSSLDLQIDSLDECLDGRNATGTCQTIFECPTLSWMIENGRRPTGGEVTFLKHSVCRLENGQLYICCASPASPDSHPNRPLLEEGKLCGTYVEQRVRGGVEVPLGRHPWMAVLLYNDIVTGEVQPHCGGALIGRQHVLTAAHCVNQSERYLLSSVLLGDHNLETPEDCAIRIDGSRVCNSPQTIGINLTFTHEEYDPASFENDIALLKLDEPAVEDEFVGKICLPFGMAAHRDYTGANLTVAGFGNTGPFRNSPRSNVLQEVALTGIRQDACRAVIERLGGHVGERQICAVGEGYRDSCPGDSGGPVIAPSPIGPPYSLVGLVSFGGERCGERDIPSVNVRVSEYMDWILDRVGD